MIPTRHDLEAYLDEALPAGQMSQIEEALRQDGELLAMLAEIQARRDNEGHSLGSIWRTARLTCLSRDQWGAYLLGTLEPELADYGKFHVETIGCRLCQATRTDLTERQNQQPADSQTRRKRYFQSSAGYLRK